MKLYIAASSHAYERPRVNEAFSWVEDFYEIIGDWRSDCDKFGANPTNVDCAPFAQADIDAVRACDVLWLLMPQTETRGAWVELGAAIAFGGKEIVVSGPGQRLSIFTALASKRFETDAEAVAYLNERVISGFRARLGIDHA